MAKLEWDKTGEREIHLGASKGVLYVAGNDKTYGSASAWNGLIGVDVNAEGGEANDYYANNHKYVTLRSAENPGFTIRAYAYPKAWEGCDGYREVTPGVVIGQQNRTSFGFCWRTEVQTDVPGETNDYIIHVCYGCTASPSDKTYDTINDSPEPAELSWECTTTPVELEGYNAVATVEINSGDVPADKLSNIENILYGSASSEPYLPELTELIGLLRGE